MNKQELIKKFEERKTIIGNFQGYAIWWEDIKAIFEELNEPKKVTIPQFVADWIEKYKTELSLREAMSQAHVSIEVNDWLIELDEDGAFLNQDIFARAWFDGYEVEREKRYVVTLKNGQPLVKSQSGNTLYFNQNITVGNYKASRKELEEAGFGWVFDCPGIEIEEVQDDTKI